MSFKKVNEFSNYSFVQNVYSCDRLLFILNTIKSDTIEYNIDDSCISIHGKDHYTLYRYCIKDNLIQNNYRDYERCIDKLLEIIFS